MPRKPKSSVSDAPLAPLRSEILDRFVHQGPLTPEEVDAAVRRFKKAIIERALGAELSHHLGYVPGGTKPDDTTNHRNGSSGKTVFTADGPLALDVPHDRDGSFEPRLIGKHERRFTGFDDKVLALYARGLTVREIQAFLTEMYGVDVSPDLISTVLPDGTRDILGIWIEQTEGAKFWMKVSADLQTRGCHDILIAVTDGLKGMSEALGAVFPATTLQTCLVHRLRHSLAFANRCGA